MAMKNKLRIGRLGRNALNIIIAILTIVALAYLYLSNGNILLRWLYAIITLGISGELIMLLNKFKGAYGAYMLGGKHGIGFIEWLSKTHKKAWLYLAEWGLTISLGIAALFIFKYINKKVFAIGIVSLVLLLYLVLPYTYISMSFLNIPQITGKINEAVANSTIAPTPNYYGYLLDAISIAGGFATLAAGSIIYNGVSILVATFTFIPTLASGKPNYNILNSQIAGVAPIIPGITMPLAAGIAALVILLIIHEFSHGVLARIAKVRLKSVGVLLFGIIPLGAYVEPDEKELKKLSKEKQERMFVAGIASNMLASIIFFIIMIALLPELSNVMHTYVSVVATIPGYPANNVIAPGSIILKWNNYPIENLSSFKVAAANDKPFSTISVETNKGTYIFKTNQTGKIGVYVQENYTPTTLFGSFIYFIFTVAALSFLLNLLVGIVNLLPIPGFDGWQIYRLEASKKVVNALAAIVLIALILNVVPWFWSI